VFGSDDNLEEVVFNGDLEMEIVEKK